MTLRFRMRRQSESTYSSSSTDSFPSFIPDASPLLVVNNGEDVLRRNESASSLPQDPRDVLAEEQILGIMDQLEDDFDKHTYEDLVPLEIRLALEENVFGWTHLSSDILGHFLFTFGAFGLAYVCLYHFTQSSPRLHWLRWILSILAAVSSFRMVRRRRQVYLRAAYGSKEYRDDEARRRKEVAEVDKSGWLERMRQKSKTRRVERQLKKAETSFSQHHERRLLRALSEPIEDDSPMKSPNMRKRRSFRTDPVAVMQSVQQDQIVFGSGLIQNMHYSHGGFFGAAPFLLANPHWIAILRHLMPDVYVEMSRRVMKAPPQRLIHWAENNPVVAAYGTAHELEYSGMVPSVEWDVFLDPLLVQRVHVVLENRENYLKSTLPESAGLKPFQTISNSTQLSSSDRNILRFFEVELCKRVRELVDKMLIAHGKLNHLILEQTGYLKHFNYSRIKRTRRTLGGGIYARQWMAVYAESLKLGVGEQSPESSPRRNLSSTSLVAMGESTCPDTTIAESVAIVQSIAKINNPVGLVLDVKSRHVPKPVWACVVDALRDAGVRVEGIGCFTIEEIRDMSQYCLNPVKEILFFHSAGDMQQACHNGRIREGDSVYFNAGSLLWKPLLDEETYSNRVRRNFSCSFDPEETKRSYEIQSFGRVSKSYTESRGPNQMDSTVECYKRRLKLSIGLYVQEFQIDEKAADILVRLVNENPHVYDLGLSWGGVNGITIRGIQPGRFTSTDGFWNQRYAGAAWDINLLPPPSSELL